MDFRYDCFYLMLHLLNSLSPFAIPSPTPQTLHIFIVSSLLQTVNTIVPFGLRLLCPIGLACARTLTSRLYAGYECTVKELVIAVRMGTRGVGAGVSDGGENEDPWVLRSSLQCGDQWTVVTEVLSDSV